MEYSTGEFLVLRTMPFAVARPEPPAGALLLSTGVGIPESSETLEFKLGRPVNWISRIGNRRNRCGVLASLSLGGGAAVLPVNHSQPPPAPHAKAKRPGGKASQETSATRSGEGTSEEKLQLLQLPYGVVKGGWHDKEP